MPQPTLFTEEFPMVRVPSMLALLVCAIVPLGAWGGQPANLGGLVSSPATTPFVDETYPGDAADAEGDSDLECCPSAAAYCPKWTVDAGAIFLSRNHASAQPSARIFTIGAPATLAPGPLQWKSSTWPIPARARPSVPILRCAAVWARAGTWKPATSRFTDGATTTCSTPPVRAAYSRWLMVRRPQPRPCPWTTPLSSITSS